MQDPSKALPQHHIAFWHIAFSWEAEVIAVRRVRCRGFFNPWFKNNAELKEIRDMTLHWQAQRATHAQSNLNEMMLSTVVEQIGAVPESLTAIVQKIFRSASESVTRP